MHAAVDDDAAALALDGSFRGVEEHDLGLALDDYQTMVSLGGELDGKGSAWVDQDIVGLGGDRGGPSEARVGVEDDRAVGVSAWQVVGSKAGVRVEASVANGAVGGGDGQGKARNSRAIFEENLQGDPRGTDDDGPRRLDLGRLDKSGIVEWALMVEAHGDEITAGEEVDRTGTQLFGIVGERTDPLFELSTAVGLPKQRVDKRGRLGAIDREDFTARDEERVVPGRRGETEGRHRRRAKIALSVMAQMGQPRWGDERNGRGPELGCFETHRHKGRRPPPQWPQPLLAPPPQNHRVEPQVKRRAPAPTTATVTARRALHANTSERNPAAIVPLRQRNGLRLRSGVATVSHHVRIRSSLVGIRRCCTFDIMFLSNALGAAVVIASTSSVADSSATSPEGADELERELEATVAPPASYGPALPPSADPAPIREEDIPEDEPPNSRWRGGAYFTMGVAPMSTLNIRAGFHPGIRYDMEAGLGWKRGRVRMHFGPDLHLMQYFGRKKVGFGIDGMATVSLRHVYARVGAGAAMGMPAGRDVSDTKPMMGGLVGAGLVGRLGDMEGRFGVDYDLRVDTSRRVAQTVLLTMRLTFGP